jgi:hypothetical protein
MYKNKLVEMGFQQPDFDGVRNAIGKVLVEIASPYNDGWTSSSCKHDLYLLKCWLEDEYNRLPKFTGEERWEADRVWNLLKQN